MNPVTDKFCHDLDAPLQTMKWQLKWALYSPNRDQHCFQEDFAKASITDMDYSLDDSALIPLVLRAHDLAMKHPCRVASQTKLPAKPK